MVAAAAAAVALAEGKTTHAAAAAPNVGSQMQQDVCRHGGFQLIACLRFAFT